jgi:hypothetical protein
MGDEATGVLGVWLLRSAYIERVDNRERSFLFGDDPRGVLILDEGGRMAAILTPSHQPGDPPPPLRKLLAYSGRTGSNLPTASSPTSISPGFRAGSERRARGPSRFGTARSTS